MADVPEVETITDAASAIFQGKRNLLVQDFNMAVTVLARACELLAQQHGDTADELAEPYLLYGRALLGLAREDNGVLAGGVPGSEEGQEGGEDDAEDDGEELDDIQEENEAESSKNPEEKAEEKKEDKAKDKAEAGSSKEEPMTNGSADSAVASSSKQNGNVNEEEEGEDVNKEDDEDEINNLQVAWEVLELAKHIILKRGPTGWKLLAESYRLLGEVAMEGGNHHGALSDLQGALDLMKKIDSCEPRAIAEIHYQLGLAHALGNEFDDSVKQFNEAMIILKDRVKELQSLTEPPKSEDPFYTVEGEIKELEGLIPEIQEKITDMIDAKQEACKLVLEGIKSKVSNGSQAGTSGEGGSSSSGTASSSSSATQMQKPTSDISHLVRKKRKADEEEQPASTDVPCKKPTPEKSA